MTSNDFWGQNDIAYVGHVYIYTVAVTGVQAASFPFVLITLLLDIVQILRQHQPDKVYIDDQLLP